jgi:DNA-binding CsgD family transcriptional regulator
MGPLRTVREVCEPVGQGSAPLLSGRERQVAALLVRGATTAGAATALGVSPWTAATYVRRLYAKLGIGSRGELGAALLRLEIEAGLPRDPPAIGW